MTTEVTNNDDVIDSRDIIARIDDLEGATALTVSIICQDSVWSWTIEDSNGVALLTSTESYGAEDLAQDAGDSAME